MCTGFFFFLAFSSFASRFLRHQLMHTHVTSGGNKQNLTFCIFLNNFVSPCNLLGRNNESISTIDEAAKFIAFSEHWIFECFRHGFLIVLRLTYDMHQICICYETNQNEDSPPVSPSPLPLWRCMLSNQNKKASRSCARITATEKSNSKPECNGNDGWNQHFIASIECLRNSGRIIKWNIRLN